MIHKTNLLHAVLCLVACIAAVSATAQTGLYVPSKKPIRNMQKALQNPEVFQLLVAFPDGEADYSDPDLDMLDSAYRIAFDQANPMLYTMVIESYGTADRDVATRRADAIYRYFAMRCHASFPIRMARNPIHCSCHGDTAEVLRFEVPVSTAVYDCAELTGERLRLDGGQQLENTVLVTFRNDPDQCVGAARGCYVPQADSTVYGYYSSLVLPKGSIRSVLNTKDTCPSGFTVDIEDHLDYREFIDQYRLIPHRRQLLAMAGYVVIKAQWQADTDTCTEPLRDSIILRVPMTQEQMEAKLKFYAKVRTPRGVEYRAVPTRKTPGKGSMSMQGQLNIGQLDTIYIGKRIEDKEIDKYFHRVATDTEASAFEAGGRYYVASRPGRDGQPEIEAPQAAFPHRVRPGGRLPA